LFCIQKDFSNKQKTMRPLIPILCFVLFFSKNTTAQIGYQLVSGGQSAAMSNAVSALSCTDAVFQNPATLAPLTRRMATIATDMRLGTPELQPIGVGFILPTKSGVLGFSLQHFGFSAFREQKIGVAIARHFSEKLDVGIRLDYMRLQAREYGSVHLLTFEIGCNTLIAKGLMLGVFVFNPLAVRLSNAERAPSVFRLGLAYTVSKFVVVAVEVEQNLTSAARFSFGLDYKITEALALRCGFLSLPTRFSFGIGYYLTKNFVMDVALSNQTLLGATPSVSLTYVFGS
jgi:hypothetical protein